MKLTYFLNFLPFILLTILLLPPRADSADTLQVPFTVAASSPFRALSRKFIRTGGWTGSDAAYTIPLSPNRTLWLFGDTWIGKIQDGKRLRDARMVNNSAAWQTKRNSHSNFEFFWNELGRKPISLIRPGKKARWYWPLDGALINGKLYLFMNILKKDTSRKTFQFESEGIHLIQVSNPQSPPTQWEIKIRALPAATGKLALGTACVEKGRYLYAYGTAPLVSSSGTRHRLVLSRISKADLLSLNMDGWEFLCQSQWSGKPANISVLLDEVAPEFTINPLPASNGYVLTYMPALGSKILIRHAKQLAGPWSDPLVAYDCPQAAKGTFYYSAKNHPELASQDYELVITYCANTESFAKNYSNPYIYCPKAVKVLLKPRASTTSGP